MKETMLPVRGYWVLCREDDDYSQEYGSGQLYEAIEYLQECREECPGCDFQLIAEIDA